MAVETSQEGSKPASPHAVDAYKTYLFRKGTVPVSFIESLKPGTPIPLGVLGNDIVAVQKTIVTCKALGLPTVEEDYKLKGLQSLWTQLAGRVWPTPKQIYDSLNQPQKSWLQGAFTNDNLAEEMAKQDKLLKAKTALAEQKAQNHPVKNASKSVKWQPKKLAPKHGIVDKMSSGLTQEFVMRVGMASNCNVTIMAKHSYSLSTIKVTMQCKVCSALFVIDNTFEVEGRDALTSGVESFCKAHRHESKPVVPDAPGRLFRTDD